MCLAFSPILSSFWRRSGLGKGTHLTLIVWKLDWEHSQRALVVKHAPLRCYKCGEMHPLWEALVQSWYVWMFVINQCVINQWSFKTPLVVFFFYLNIFTHFCNSWKAANPCVALFPYFHEALNIHPVCCKAGFHLEQPPDVISGKSSCSLQLWVLCECSSLTLLACQRIGWCKFFARLQNKPTVVPNSEKYCCSWSSV